MATAISSEEMQTLWRIAEAMHASGDYKEIESPAQAFNRIMIGRDLGLAPAQAMMGIDLVRGNLQIRAVLLASFVRKSREYDYDVVKHDERGCTLRFYRVENDTELGESTFTIEDAHHAKLIRPGSPWETVPRNMVFARAMSNGVKWYCPDLLGGVPVYTEGDDLTGVEAPAIGASEEDTPPGWKGVSVQDAAEVEKVVRRAEKLGHAGLANLAAAQMALNDQPRGLVGEWIKQANTALDSLAKGAEELQGEPDEDAPEPQEPEGGFDVPAKVKPLPGERPATREDYDPPMDPPDGETVIEDRMPDARGAAPDPIPGQTTLADAKPEEE